MAGQGRPNADGALSAGAGTPLRVTARATGTRFRVGHFASAGDAVTLVQRDGTTCGATSLLALRLILASAGGGAGADGAEPATAAPAAGTARASGPARPGRALLDALGDDEGELQRTMNRRAGGPLGPLPWTHLLGSTPWAVARALEAELTRAGRPGAHCGVDWVKDTGVSWPERVEALRASLAAGTPAILLVGGPLRAADAIPARLRAGGLGSRLAGAGRAVGPAIPRHYVLALPAGLAGREPAPEGCADIYDPSSGAVGTLDLVRFHETDPAPRLLGGWTSVLAIIEPITGRRTS